MTAKGHFLFSIICTIFAKNTGLTLILAQSDWWHIIPSAILTCLLPDIDHPKSFLGQQLKWISKLIVKLFNHRGFTHSFLATFIILILLKLLNNWIKLASDIVQGMILGYISHIFADMLTPAGVPLLWPLRWRFCLPILFLRKNKWMEYILCIVFFIFAVQIPQILLKSDIIHWSSHIINTLKLQYNYINL